MNNIIEYFSGICSGDKIIKEIISPLIEPLAVSYIQVFQMLVTRREFYGLRDFYRLYSSFVFYECAVCKID